MARRLACGLRTGLGSLTVGIVRHIASFSVSPCTPPPSLLSPQYTVTGEGLISDSAADIVWACPHILKCNVQTMPGYKFSIRVASSWSTQMLQEYFEACLLGCVKCDGGSSAVDEGAESQAASVSGLHVERLQPESLPWPAKLTIVVNHNHNERSLLMHPDPEYERVLKQVGNRFKSKKKMRRLFLRDGSEIDPENWGWAGRVATELLCSVGEPFNAPNVANMDKKCNRVCNRKK